MWELYYVANDFSQAHDLAAKEPDRLSAMKELFLAEAKANKALPIGGGLWTRFHPEDMISSPYKSWRFDATTTRMPEFSAPALGKRSNHVAIDVEVGDNASGVLYALGGVSGGVALYMDNGLLVYEYNMLIIERTKVKSRAKIVSGKHKIEVDETIARPGPRPMSSSRLTAKRWRMRRSSAPFPARSRRAKRWTWEWILVRPCR